jgi:uncharacterized protein YndB with AHSA1/START domain
MSAAENVVERTVLIRARRETVFRYFTDSTRFAAWWGEGSRIEPRPGGEVHIRYPNGVVAAGEVLEIAPSERVVFTFGYEGPEPPIPPGGSRVTIALEEGPEGTLLRLRHEVPTAEAREAHGPGWRYQLALFANVAAREQHAAVETLVDRFLAVWSEPDAALRRAALGEVATEHVTFRDAFACTEGRDDLVGHIAAARQHLAEVRMERRGPVRHCQGTVVADWVTLGSDGRELGRGTNVYDLVPDGRIARVVGLRA